MSGGSKAAVQVVSRKPEQSQGFGAGVTESASAPDAVWEEGSNVPLVEKLTAAQNAPPTEKRLSLSIGAGGESRIVSVPEQPGRAYPNSISVTWFPTVCTR